MRSGCDDSQVAAVKGGMMAVALPTQNDTVYAGDPKGARAKRLLHLDRACYSFVAVDD